MGKRGPQPTGQALTPAEKQRRYRDRKAAAASLPAGIISVQLPGFERSQLRALAQPGETESDTAARLLRELIRTAAMTPSARGRHIVGLIEMVAAESAATR